ncbi:SufE family protein [bacterium]|jgi:cysteine desulfuration protein SufE|nr:SufE family protein [Pirellulales bacterium]NBP82136.1 SufE family protein [bacterium]
MSTVAERLDEVVEDFVDLDGREKLEMLLEYAATLPPLPPGQKGLDENRVHECQSPVFIRVELKPTSDGHAGVHLQAEVAEEAPTVKGFVAMLAKAFTGRPTDEVLAVDDTLLDRLGLADVLGMLRTRGLRAIIEYVKRGVVRSLADSAS